MEKDCSVASRRTIADGSTKAMASPMADAATASVALSTSNWRTIRHRLPPMESRTAISAGGPPPVPVAGCRRSRRRAEAPASPRRTAAKTRLRAPSSGRERGSTRCLSAGLRRRAPACAVPQSVRRAARAPLPPELASPLERAAPRPECSRSPDWSGRRHCKVR